MAKQKFFLVVPPGFEDLAHRELQYRHALDAPQTGLVLTEKTKGGFELEGQMAEGLKLNYSSRIGVRVLLRLAQFRCRDFPKLFNKIKSFEWQEYIRGSFDVEVSAHRSRLMNKKRIAETVREGITKALGSKLGLKKDSAEKETAMSEPTRVFVRFQYDECQLSLDTSGEGLYKRGYKNLQAVAPLRENLAAGLFWYLYESSGRPSKFTLLDPLCGSGTFLTEATLFFSPLPRDNYDFQKWFKGHEPAVGAIASEPKFSLIGFDRHQQALFWARENLQNLKSSRAYEAVIEQGDFLDPEHRLRLLDVPNVQKMEKDAIRLGIANPPYGVRIQLPQPPKEFYHQLIQFFVAFQCHVFGFILPRAHLRFVPKPDHALNFSNGGLPVTFVMYTSQPRSK